jgi:hypothetical protein
VRVYPARNDAHSAACPRTAHRPSSSTHHHCPCNVVATHALLPLPRHVGLPCWPCALPLLAGGGDTAMRRPRHGFQHPSNLHDIALAQGAPQFQHRCIHGRPVAAVTSPGDHHLHRAPQRRRPSNAREGCGLWLRLAAATTACQLRLTPVPGRLRCRCTRGGYLA